MKDARAEHAVRLQVAAGGVHLWHASLAADATEIASYAMLLSPDEAARADRYVFDAHRARFTAGRGILREVLSRYTGTPAETIVFTYGQQGKPELAQPGDSPLRFNAAHSEDRLVVAVTCGQMIGVDIEQVRPMHDLMLMAKRFFSAREVEELRSLPAAKQSQAFFNAWTRKEAILKAYGEGISEVLNTVEVSLLPDEPAALFSIRGSTEEAARWSLRALDAPTGFIAALAVEHSTEQIAIFDYHAA
jgi:4'-phosphopantetheinyl transferase